MQQSPMMVASDFSYLDCIFCIIYMDEKEIFILVDLDMHLDNKYLYSLAAFILIMTFISDFKANAFILIVTFVYHTMLFHQFLYISGLVIEYLLSFYCPGKRVFAISRVTSSFSQQVSPIQVLFHVCILSCLLFCIHHSLIISNLYYRLFL